MVDNTLSRPNACPKLDDALSSNGRALLARTNLIHLGDRPQLIADEVGTMLRRYASPHEVLRPAFIEVS